MIPLFLSRVNSALQRSLFEVAFFFMFASVCDANVQDLTQLPTKCESCLLVSRELEAQFRILEKSSEFKASKNSEMWLIDILDTICQKMLAYRIHKDKEGLERFSKLQSPTMNTLNKLRERGVKVIFEDYISVSVFGLTLGLLSSSDERLEDEETDSSKCHKMSYVSFFRLHTV
ncbi:hypothetical protein AB6A40_010955 [Gnathostoma spinigerum]|uniref:DUF3456 domain-containing protein n=1 Tax=Gnathostoma spinigerum TaxID=75299 RepID=A0ABD6EWH2_9BILA